jgi:hypothetical protein
MQDPDYRRHYKRAAIAFGVTGGLSFAVPFVLCATDFFLNHPALFDSLPPLCLQPALIAFALCLPAVWIGWMGEKHQKTGQKITQCAHGLSVATGLTLIFHLWLGGMTQKESFWHSLLAHSLHPGAYNNITAIASLTLGAVAALTYVGGLLKECLEEVSNPF